MNTDYYAAYTSVSSAALFWVAAGSLIAGFIVAFCVRLTRNLSLSQFFALIFGVGILAILGIYSWFTLGVIPDSEQKGQVAQTALTQMIRQETLWNGDLVVTYKTIQGPASIVIPKDIVQRQHAFGTIPKAIFANIILLYGGAYLFVLIILKRD